MKPGIGGGSESATPIVAWAVRTLWLPFEGVLSRTEVVVSFVVIVGLSRPVEAGSGLFEAGDAEQGELDFIG
jgi:hypothetical protein